MKKRHSNNFNCKNENSQTDMGNLAASGGLSQTTYLASDEGQLIKQKTGELDNTDKRDDSRAPDSLDETTNKPNHSIPTSM
jgi:hypothetical protein